MTETMISTKAVQQRSSGGDMIGPGWLRTAGILLFVLTVSFLVHAQPPPLGPPTYKADQTQISQSVLVGIVKTTAENAVATANTTLKNKGSSIRVEMIPLKSWPAYRIATVFTDRQNQFYVKLPTIVGINVNIPVTSDRQIYIPLDLNVSCDGWQTGNGVIRVTAQPGPASVEGGNIIEDVLTIRDTITNLVKSNFTPPPAMTQTLSSKCVSIGVSPNSDNFSFIAWDPAPNRRLPIATGAAAPRETLQVTFTQIKRLVAHASGGVLYNPTENIMLETYANFAHNQSPVLTMKEGDVVNLNIPKVVLTPPLLDSLVVIANIGQQPNGQPLDSGFAAALRSANYSSGVHTLQITKSYVIPAGPGHIKPIIAHMPAYELTYNVQYATSSILSH